MAFSRKAREEFFGIEKSLGWLIDTGVWIAVERGKVGARTYMRDRQEPVYLSP